MESIHRMGTKAVTGGEVGVEMLQVRQRRMFQSKEINMRAGSNFSDAMEERGICCKKEIPPKSTEESNTDVTEEDSLVVWIACPLLLLFILFILLIEGHDP